MKTCELAGFGAAAEPDPDLVEWDYGRFEGMLTKNILKQQPGWELFRDGCPEGESPDDVASRADRFIARVRGIEGDVLAFSSGHIIRMIAARWLRLPPQAGRFFYCRPASVGVLGFEHKNRDEPIIGLWNHVAPTSGVSRADHGRSVPAGGMNNRGERGRVTVAKRVERSASRGASAESVGRSVPWAPPSSRGASTSACSPGTPQVSNSCSSTARTMPPRPARYASDC